MLITWATEPLQETHSPKADLLEAMESPAMLANKWGSTAWKMPPPGSKGKQQSFSELTLSWLSLGPSALYRMISPTTPPVSVLFRSVSQRVAQGRRSAWGLLDAHNVIQILLKGHYCLGMQVGLSSLSLTLQPPHPWPKGQKRRRGNDFVVALKATRVGFYWIRE